MRALNRIQQQGTSWLAIGLAFCLKAYYSRAGADELLWVLAPSGWLAKFVGGIDLVYERGAGFITHAHHMVVGPACAGVNFLVICFLCLYFSFVRRYPNKPRWLACSALIAYFGTIVANGLRISVSAYLWDSDFYKGWMSTEDMHRFAGIAIYYASLLALYFIVDSRIGGRSSTLSPLAWYLGISLGVPLAGRAFSESSPEFASHAAWVIAVALLLTLVYMLVKALPYALRNRLHYKS